MTSFGAVTVKGVGDDAFVAHSSSKTANSYDIFWRHGAVLASVQLSGPVGDSHISTAETKQLALLQLSRAG